MDSICFRFGGKAIISVRFLIRNHPRAYLTAIKKGAARVWAHSFPLALTQRSWRGSTLEECACPDYRTHKQPARDALRSNRQIGANSSEVFIESSSHHHRLRRSL